MSHAWHGRARRALAGQGAMARLSRGILGSGGVWIVRLITTIGMSFLLGHLLGPTEYGVYATVVTHVTMLAPLCSLGSDMLATREFVAVRVDGDRAREARLANTLPRLVWRNAAVLMLCFVPLSIGYNLVFDTGYEFTVVFEAAGIVLTAHLRLIQGSLTGLGKVSRGQFYQLILPPLANLALFLAMLIALRPNAQLAIATFIAGLALAMPLGARAVRKLAWQAPERASPRERRDWSKAAWVLGFSQVMGVATDQAPLALTAAMSGSTQVGLLDIARRFAMCAAIALNVIQLPLAPMLAEMHRKEDRAGFRRAALHTTYVASAISLLVTGAYLIAGRWLLGLIDPGFVQAYAAMLILCLGYTINTLTGPVPLVLTMTGHERDAVNGIVAGAVVNIAICLALIPWLGHLGAAIGSVIGQFVWNVLMAVMVRRRFGMALDVLAVFERRR